jgi:hypothetical protein
MTWTIYAIEVAGRYEYIGHAKHPKQREAQHAIGLFYGVDFKFIPLGSRRTKEGARRLESSLIRRHKPARNIQFMGARPYELVKTIRWNGSDRWLPHEFRLCSGVMHPDHARDIWHKSRLSRTNDVLKLMPGWTGSAASRMFGPRRMGKGVRFPSYERALKEWIVWRNEP